MSVAKSQDGSWKGLLAFRQRNGIRTVLVALVIHTLASWTFVLITDVQRYDTDLFSPSLGTLLIPLWTPALLLYDLFSLLTSIFDVAAAHPSKCAFDWLAYLLPLLAWWGLWRLTRAIIRRVESSLRPAHRRYMYRAFSLGSFGLALFLVVNALVLHWGTYLMAGKGSFHAGMYKEDGCALLVINLIGPTLSRWDMIFQYPQGLEWGKTDWPGGFWLILKIPFWILSVPLAALGLLAQYRLKRSAANETFCKKCSYDLRSHAPGDKCPECGTPIPLSSAPCS